MLRFLYMQCIYQRGSLTHTMATVITHSKSPGSIIIVFACLELSFNQFVSLGSTLTAASATEKNDPRVSSLTGLYQCIEQQWIKALNNCTDFDKTNTQHFSMR